MKNIKIVVVGLVSMMIICGAVFYTVRFFNKPLVIKVIGGDVQQPIVQQVESFDAQRNDEKVVIQSQCFIDNDDQKEDTTDFIESDAIAEKIKLSSSDSFVTMQLQHAGKLDENLQEVFDLLIGNNIDALLDLIAQSNNNILSTDSCRTCAIDAILKKVSKHKRLSQQEFISLQHVIANLYKFVNTMQKLSNKSMLTAEQFIALKDLNTSQTSKEQLKAQARQAATSVILQALHKIDMVQRHG